MAMAPAPSTRAGPVTGISAVLARQPLAAAATLVLLAAFVALVGLVAGHRGPLPGDVGVTLWWQHLVRPHALLTAGIDVFRTLNLPLPATLTMLVLVALFALSRRWLDLLLAAMVVAGADGGNWLINLLIRRPRPAGYGIVVEQHLTGYYSFPSGHVEHALAVLGLVVFLSVQLRRLGPWPTAALWVGRIALVALIVLQSPAAVLEGEHWPSDGLAGLLWGGVWLLVGIQLYPWTAARWPRLVPANERREAATRMPWGEQGPAAGAAPRGPAAACALW